MSTPPNANDTEQKLLDLINAYGIAYKTENNILINLSVQALKSFLSQTVLRTVAEDKVILDQLAKLQAAQVHAENLPKVHQSTTDEVTYEPYE